MFYSTVNIKFDHIKQTMRISFISQEKLFFLVSYLLVDDPHVTPPPDEPPSPPPPPAAVAPATDVLVLDASDLLHHRRDLLLVRVDLQVDLGVSGSAAPVPVVGVPLANVVPVYPSLAPVVVSPPSPVAVSPPPVVSPATVEANEEEIVIIGFCFVVFV